MQQYLDCNSDAFKVDSRGQSLIFDLFKADEGWVSITKVEKDVYLIK